MNFITIFDYLHFFFPEAYMNIFYKQSSNPGCNSTTKRLPRRKSRQPQTHLLLQSNWRVPRLCRTSSILSPICSSRCRMPRIQPALPPQNIFGARDDDFVRVIYTKIMVYRYNETNLNILFLFINLDIEIKYFYL